MSDSALAANQKDVLDAINSNESQYTEAVKIQGESKRLSSVYLLDIETEAQKLTKKILKKLSLLEQGEDDFDAYDSDDSQVMSQADRELLEKYQEDEKDELQETLSKSTLFSLANLF